MPRAFHKIHPQLGVNENPGRNYVPACKLDRMSDFHDSADNSEEQLNASELPALDLPQAVPTPTSPHTIWHCGDPFAEQRAAQTAGYLDLRHLAVLHVAGEDAPSWLNSLLTQKVDDLSPTNEDAPLGVLRRAYVLDVQGRIEFEMWVTRGPDGFLLAIPRSMRAALRDYLHSMVFWSKVTVRESDLAVVALTGTKTTSSEFQHQLAALLSSTPEEDSDAALQLFAVGKPRGLDLIVGFLEPSQTQQVHKFLRAENFTPSGRWTWDALRVEHGLAEMATDGDSRSLPHEFDSVGTPEAGAGASTTKGCYRGQETVAKIHNVGLPPRRQVVLLLDGSSEARPSSGTALVNAAGKEVGRCGTVVDHWEYGPMASGLVKRTTSDAEELTWETAEGSGSAKILSDLSYHPEERKNARETVQSFRKAAKKRQL